MRRSPRDMQLLRFVQIGQEWSRRGDRSRWVIEQIYRVDGMVLLARLDARERRAVLIPDLRAGWLWRTRNHEATR